MKRVLPGIVAEDFLSAEIAAENIAPVDCPRPGGPEIRDGAGTTPGDARPPLARPKDAAGKVRFTVAIEIADLHVNPTHIRAPLRPKTVAET